MTQQANFEITIAIQDADLDNDELQEETQNLREQLEESEIVESADLVAVNQAPVGSKAFGGFILGLLNAKVNPVNIKKLMGFLGDRLGNKQIELTLNTPDGREINLKASSREEFEFAFQKAQEWAKSNSTIEEKTNTDG
ncbi:hypothetical protein Cri9333_3510 [Crinalium epipsammum PCC 9333]|uniref:Uncharacterized protein n=1 Tax=Crinalium epipsammum PCC 9333 TaxID=1173022 RepID=K9W4F3_9CYAN|nr:hypothetical protein [Crinalium epipsammum]AFZ14335.1 hypothetical protein Cri9333_3510 [Crinalium epipsammum PCC 9333]